MGGREEEEVPRFLYTLLGAGHPIGRPYKLNFQGRHTPSAAPANLICRGGSPAKPPLKIVAILGAAEGVNRPYKCI